MSCPQPRKPENESAGRKIVQEGMALEKAGDMSGAVAAFAAADAFFNAPDRKPDDPLRRPQLVRVHYGPRRGQHSGLPRSVAAVGYLRGVHGGRHRLPA